MQYSQLSNENIQGFIDDLEVFLKPVSMEKHDKLWLHLTLEELLLKYQDVLPAGQFGYKVKKRFGSILVELFDCNLPKMVQLFNSKKHHLNYKNII